MDLTNKVENVTFDGMLYFAGVSIPARIISPIGVVYHWDEGNRQWISAEGQYLSLKVDLGGSTTIINDPELSGMICRCCYPEAYADE